MQEKSRAKLQEILKQRDRTADVTVFADAATAEFGGAGRIFKELRLLFDDERTQIPVKARILEIVLDFAKEASKTRNMVDPSAGIPDDELAAVVEGLDVDQLLR